MTAATPTCAQDVEVLQQRIATLVHERQQLRQSRADGDRLEHNRLEIADLQQRLSRALIARYAPLVTTAF